METIKPFKFLIERTQRNQLNKHNSFVIWFTGLSGSGKSTLANLVEAELFKSGVRTFSLDGDNIREGLNKNLSFTAEDRRENLRIIAEIAKLFVESGTVVLASFISPNKSGRDMVKQIIGEEDYIEVYLNASLETCEKRDVKGLYEMARTGKIKNFTGIDAPFEVPENPDIEVKEGAETLEEASKRIVLQLQDKLKISVQ